MWISLAALICIYVTTAKTSELGFESIDGKVTGGDLIEMNEYYFKRQIGSLLYDNELRGVGIFLSENLFLTVAQNLYTKQEDMPSERIRSKYLKIFLHTGTFHHDKNMNLNREFEINVLKAYIHPKYEPGSFRNDIALLLTEKYDAINKIPRKIRLRLPYEGSSNDPTDLYAYEILKQDSVDTYSLRSLQVLRLPSNKCNEDYKDVFDETDHLCGTSRTGHPEENDVGSPLIECNRIVGLLIIGTKNGRNESLYVNVLEKMIFIKQGQELLDPNLNWFDLLRNIVLD